MKSNDKWQRKRLNNSGYEKDDTVGMDRDESPLKNILIAGAIAVGGVAAYKSGLLKKGISELIEYGDRYEPFIREGREAIREWTRPERGEIPAFSLFRTKFIGKADDYQTRLNYTSLVKNEHYRRLVFQNTLDDLSLLKSKWDDHMEGVLQRVKNKDQTKSHLYRTELATKIRNLKRTEKEIATSYSERTVKNIHQTMVEELIESSQQTVEQGRLKINRTGYRTATLGDLFEMREVGEGIHKKGKLLLKTEYYNRFDAKQYGFLKTVEEFLNSSALQATTVKEKDKLGKEVIKTVQDFKPIRANEKWKSMIIDPNIMINESGKVADLRGAANELNSFIYSLSNDFQIPVIGLNPLRLVGVGNKQYQKDQFGMLYKNTIQPLVTKQSGHDATLGNTFQNSVLFFANDKLFEYNTLNQTTTQMNKKFKFWNLSGSGEFGTPSMAKRRSGLTNELHALHLLGNLDYYEKIDYTKADGTFKYYLGQLGKVLDVGRQDVLKIPKDLSKDKSAKVEWKLFDDDSFTNYLQPDFYANKASEWFGSRLTSYKSLGRQNFNIAKDNVDTNITHLLGSAPEGIRQFQAVPKRYTFKETWQSGEWDHFLKQFVAGRKADGSMSEDVTELTLAIAWSFNRPVQSLASFGLDLSNESKKSSLDIIKNMVLKRFLPIYAGYQAFEMLNMIGPDLDDDGSPENITKLGAEVVKNIDLGYHKIKDVMGITTISKTLAPLTPGAEQLPVSELLDLESTTEEREDWYETGYVPVRKGRWWGLGNTPWSGGRIEYWQPNWYRRVQADVKFSDSLYGSRQEYFTSWLNPYHYDEKHYYDRPYLMTSGIFQNIPYFGPALDSTIGRLIKPQKKMHEEYWRQGGESLGSLAPGFELEPPLEGEIGFMPGEEEREEEQFVSYTTPSGNTSILGIPLSENVTSLNQYLPQHALAQLTQVNSRPSVIPMNLPTLSSDILNPKDLRMAASETYSQISNLQGMLGFIASDFVIGDMELDAKAIESSEFAYSFNRHFWDANIGGMGGDLMEIVRRMIPNRRKDVEWVNPIRNTMPTWLPGSDYFTNFQIGDPYTKIAKGELRLPGEGYERLHGIKLNDDLSIGSSYLGKSKSDIIQHFLKEDTVTDAGLQDILDIGNEIHEEYEQKLIDLGIAIDVEGEVKNKEHNIIGYYDVMLHDPSSPTGFSVMDVKTIGEKAFRELEKTQEAKLAHRTQVNFYMHELGLQQAHGYVTYINRDNPEEDVLTVSFEYDEALYQSSIQNLEDARDEVRTSLENGTLGRGAFYSHVDRYRILADVAPYSQAFKEQKKIINAIDLTPEQEEEIKEINERVRQQKQPLRLYPYRFKTANVTTEKVTVTRVLDSGSFLTKEYPNHPIKLAGVRTNSQPNEKGQTIFDIYDRYLKPGQKVEIAYDYDLLNKYSSDTTETIRASVTSRGRNLNRLVVEAGVATEKEDDFSPAAVHARFNPLERTFGGLWETVAHLNTPLHTKLLQVRSPYESYRLREVYGKDFQNWVNPIDDFLIPTFQVNVERDWIPAIFFGGLLGAMFGSNKAGRFVGGVVGVSTVAATKLAISVKEAVTDEKWIPKRRQEERDLEEYVDRLKYIKNKRLYEEYRRRAWFEDHIDIEAVLATDLNEGDSREFSGNLLMDIKKALKLKTKQDEQTEREIKRVNKELNQLQSYRKVGKLSENATKAIYYYQQSEKTMYGYDQGEPLQNILTALPKKDRQYLNYFLEAPEEERQKILDIVPSYVKRVLQMSWGMEYDPKASLKDYFTTHYLPEEEWVGWDEEVDLDSVRVKLIKKADLDFSEFDVWDDAIEKANAYGEIPIPKINRRENPAVVKQRLRQLLGRQGLREIDIQTSYATRQSQVQIALKEDAQRRVRGQLEKQLKEE